MTTLVYPPFIKFNHMFQRPQQLFTHLARLGLQAIYHDPGMSSRVPPYVEKEPNLFLLSQYAPLREIPHQPPVLWISYPPYWHLVGRYYDERLVVFDVCDAAADEFAEWASGCDELLELADLVFCSSWPLYQEYRHRHPHVYLCPNGVDYQHFSHIPEKLSDQLSQLPRPIIGYHGAVASWLDWDLIRELALLRPQWSFVFVGPPYNLSFSDLPRLPNLIYCGEQPYEQLPSYLHGFDAGIVPFRVSEMTAASDPIKVYEYLAAGKGVVATPLPQVQDNPCVRVADTALDFVAALEATLDTDDSACRQRWASNQSWERRARLIAAALGAFDEEVERIDAVPASPSTMQQEIAQFLADQVPATSYLEAGAGTGLSSACLTGISRRVAALDMLPTSLRALRHHQGVEAYRADLFNLPFADDEFEVVWNAGVIEHYPPAQQLQAVLEMKRVASQAVVIAVPHRDCLPYRLGRHVAELSGQWPYGREATYRTLAPLFREAGLRLELETDISHQAGYWFMNQYLPGWNEFLPSDYLNSAGYLLIGVGRPE